jgi:spore coat polysaccharide biosynthesis predicted glycosyltransferase SpsG
VPLVGIRADGDAGREAGIGHIYRSLAYAKELRREAGDVSIRFYMRDFAEGIEKVRAEGYLITVLPIRPARADYDAAFSANAPDLLIIDTLGSSADLVASARVRTRAVITIDDVEPSAAEADVIVNGILWGTRHLPETWGHARVYQGPEYIQLREQFAESKERVRRVKRQVENVVVSTGGADGRGFAPQFIDSLRSLPFDCSVIVVAGPAYRNVGALRRHADSISGRVHFTVIENTPEMAMLLGSADIALVTGGTVMFESAACGTPMVVACSYEHQLAQANAFAARGAAVNLGYFEGKLDANAVRTAIVALAETPEARQSIRNAGSALVDGQGLDRFVKIAINLLGRASPPVTLCA